MSDKEKIMDEIFKEFNNITQKDCKWMTVQKQKDRVAYGQEKINTQTLQPNKVLMSQEDWDLFVEWDSHPDNTLTVEDVQQVYYEVMNQGFQVQPIYINIDEDEEDINDWLDEYFLTYAPQSSYNTSCEKDDSECKKECKDKKECCVKCTCSIKDLMAYGCRCGAAKKEKEDK